VVDRFPTKDNQMNTSGCVACARRGCLELSKPIPFSDAVASRICFMEEKHEIPKSQCIDSLVGGLKHEWIMTFQKQLGSSSSQLTIRPSFFRGVGLKTTNQLC